MAPHGHPSPGGRPDGPARPSAEALRESEARFQALFDESLDPILLADDGGAYVDVNPAACALLGYGRDELLGMTIGDLSGADEAAFREAWDRFLRDGRTEGEYRLRARHGDVDVEFRAVAHVLPGLHMSSLRDVTDRRRAERALREGADEARALADAAPAMLWVTDPDGSCSFLSRAWYEYTGQGDRAGEGAGWIDAVHPDDRARARDAFHRANRRADPFQVDYRLRRADGAYRWALAVGRPRPGPAGEYLGYVGAVIDVDDRRRAEDAVRRLNATLEARVEERTREARAHEGRARELARALTLAEHAERRRIADLLHEDLQQQLYGLDMTLRALGPHCEGDDGAGPLYDRALGILGQALALTRSLSHELAPPVLRGGTLAELLEWLAERKRALYGLDVGVEVRGDVEVPEDDVRVLLYRVLRELLLNAAKHAGTGRVRIVAERADGRVCLTVEDDGAGFDPVALDSTGGVGLTSVRERIELVGGRLTVGSAPGAGTRVAVEVPSSAAAPPVASRAGAAPTGGRGRGGT